MLHASSAPYCVLARLLGVPRGCMGRRSMSGKMARSSPNGRSGRRVLGGCAENVPSSDWVCQECAWVRLASGLASAASCLMRPQSNCCIVTCQLRHVTHASTDRNTDVTCIITLRIQRCQTYTLNQDQRAVLKERPSRITCWNLPAGRLSVALFERKRKQPAMQGSMVITPCVRGYATQTRATRTTGAHALRD